MRLRVQSVLFLLLYLVQWFCVKGDVQSLKSFKNAIDQLYTSFSKSSDFLNIYRSLLNNKGARLETFDAPSELRSYTTRFGNIISATKQSLREAVSWTEEEASKYAWNPRLTAANVTYVDLRRLKLNDPRLTSDDRYPFKIYKGHSGVHVPVEVYGGDKLVFHTLKWTASLDYIFNQTKGLNFIYFASISGIMRVYPAFSWEFKGVDMFDIRRRSWYNQGSTVPKDILLLLDTSGSMTGQSLKVANVSAQKIVSNLDENDYVAVAHFPGVLEHEPLALVNANNETQAPCFKSFVRATKRNKMRLFHDLGSIKARGYARFDKALVAAFKLFENLTMGQRPDRANMVCNQVLVVITDDALHFDDNLIAALKQKPENIRVLFYALGDPVSTIAEYEKSACYYRGHYMYLPAVGAVSNLIKDYHEKSTRIACGPNDSPLPADVVLHGAADLYQTVKYHGTGLMVSLSMPVYNRTNGTEFVGLMGTNLPVEHMVAQLPTHKLGPLAYGFAVNANGYVVFHPTLLREVPKKEEPPNFDWLDLEFDHFKKKDQVRKKLIDNEEGVQQMTDFIKVTDGVHTYNSARNYAYANLPGTDFGVALVTPVQSNTFFTITHSEQLEVQQLPGGAFAINNVPLKEVLLNCRAVVPKHILDGNKLPVLEEPSRRPVVSQIDQSLIRKIVKTTTTTSTTTTTTTTSTKPPTTTEEKTEDSEMSTESTGFDFYNIFQILRNARSVANISDQTEDYCRAADLSSDNSTEPGDCKTNVQTTETPAHSTVSYLDLQETTTPASFSPTEKKKTIPVPTTGIETRTTHQTLPAVDKMATATVKPVKRPMQPSTTKTPSYVTAEEKESREEILVEKSTTTEVIDGGETNTIPISIEKERSVTESSDLVDESITEALETNTTEPTIDFMNATKMVGLPTMPVNTSDSLSDPEAIVKEAAQQSASSMTPNAKTKFDKYKPSPAKIRFQAQTPLVIKLPEFLRTARLQHKKNTDQVRRILFDLHAAEADLKLGQPALKSPVRSRTIALNSGLMWTVPKQYEEAFEAELARAPASSIHQRVFDANGLLFWVPLQIAAYSPPTNQAETNQTRMESTTTATTSIANATLPSIANMTDATDKPNATMITVTEEPIIVPEEKESVEEEVKAPVEQPIPDPPPVTVFKVLELNDGSTKYKAGVVGLTLESGYIPSQLQRIPDCSPNSNKICYFLDDGGFVLSVNQVDLNNRIGIFLGSADPPLMRALLQDNLYDSVDDYNFQATCYPMTEMTKTTSTASILSPTSIRICNGVVLLVLGTNVFYGQDTFPIPLTHTLVIGMLMPLVTAAGGSSGKLSQEPYSCIQLTRRFYATHNSIYPEHSKDAEKVFRGTINCSETCMRSWSIQNVVGTNLQLLIADPACDICGEWDEELSFGPFEDTGPNVCEEALNPRYRRQQDRCSAQIHPHDTLACSSSHLATTLFTISIPLMCCIFKSFIF